jgi:hypothetical protein
MKGHSNKSGFKLGGNARKSLLSHVNKIILPNALEIKKVDPIFTLRILEEIIFGEADGTHRILIQTA